jgi:hypothetical protein
VDADHVGSKTVDEFISSSDFFTTDVADFIKKLAVAHELESFVNSMSPFRRQMKIPGIETEMDVSYGTLWSIILSL